MLSEGETSVFLTKRSFDKPPLTDFCKNQNISKLKIGPFQGPDILVASPPGFHPGLSRLAPFQGPGAEDSKSCHIRIIHLDYLG
ncbi:hypothetical protein DDZ16_17145 [Marinilabilia rubra]|uniref:Uncharacterized protein n=1 Tax=Marinilabilia rubra TaxID=2162893 RepID=A0A2U2B4S0_9BACT|nr:hypothetical protein DDZ16_17145 [Marinilabilia rubra]